MDKLTYKTTMRVQTGGFVTSTPVLYCDENGNWHHIPAGVPVPVVKDMKVERADA